MRGNQSIKSVEGDAPPPPVTPPSSVNQKAHTRASQVHTLACLLLTDAAIWETRARVSFFSLSRRASSSRTHTHADITPHPPTTPARRAPRWYQVPNEAPPPTRKKRTDAPHAPTRPKVPKCEDEHGFTSSVGRGGSWGRGGRRALGLPA